MSRINLPSITVPTPTGPAEEKSPTIFDVHPIAEEEEVGETQFDSSFQRLASIQFPPMVPASSVKNRIGALEDSTQSQHEFNALSTKTFQNLSNNVTSLEDMMREFVRQTQGEIEGKMNLMKKENDHRWDDCVDQLFAFCIYD